MQFALSLGIELTFTGFPLSIFGTAQYAKTMQ